MSDVSTEEGRDRVERGERILRSAGLRIDGFVAPAWSMPRWLLPLLGQRGYRFTEDHLRVYDPAAGRARASVVLNWATRSPARLVVDAGVVPLASTRGRSRRRASRFDPAGHALPRVVREEFERLLRWASGDVVPRGADLLA